MRKAVFAKRGGSLLNCKNAAGTNIFICSYGTFLLLNSQYVFLRDFKVTESLLFLVKTGSMLLHTL